MQHLALSLCPWDLGGESFTIYHFRGHTPHGVAASAAECPAEFEFQVNNDKNVM